MVVGDPLVARVKRDLPGVEARGYPVQVRISYLLSRCQVADGFSIPPECRDRELASKMLRNGWSNRARNAPTKSSLSPATPKAAWS